MYQQLIEKKEKLAVIGLAMLAFRLPLNFPERFL
jgi:hypothetical protein